MHIVASAWSVVVLLMTVAEATSTQGTVLGAVFTLLLYGVLPLSIVLYVMGTPQRRRARLAAEQAERAEAQAAAAEAAGTASGAGRHGSGQAAGAAVAAEREEP
ncbi:MAG: hypothetical protein CFE45_26210 [Burkholderiales bacterium PBB5]|nr:MAG: hypothetical protein CFE45_26210 [Burkholderiales bacterium PBB5]